MTKITSKGGALMAAAMKRTAERACREADEGDPYMLELDGTAELAAFSQTVDMRGRLDT